MRALRNFFTVFISFTSFAQSDEVSSLYFTESQPSNGVEVGLDNFQGTFRLVSDTNQLLTITGDTIVSRMLYPVRITESDFYANPKWMMRNGYVHGVVRNDSVKYEKLHDTIHFVIQYRSIMFAPSEKAVCKLLSDGKIVVNYMEMANKWVCMILEKTVQNEIIIRHLDHDAVRDVLSSLGSSTEESGALIPTKLVTPSKTEFLKFVNEGGFSARSLKYQPLLNFGG